MKAYIVYAGKGTSDEYWVFADTVEECNKIIQEWRVNEPDLPMGYEKGPFDDTLIYNTVEDVLTYGR